MIATLDKRASQETPALTEYKPANVRREQRFKVNQPVKVTVVGTSESSFQARIADLSKSGMRLILDRFVPFGSALKIEWNGHLALGSVCYCQEHESSFAAGLQLFSSWETLTEEVLAREAAELSRSNAELEQFVSVASHDLKEPLRMISSYLQLLERRYKGKLDSDADEFIKFAVDGAVRMQSLVNDLLAYSRISRANLEMQLTDCEMVLQKVLANLGAAIAESQASVTHDPLPSVVANHSQLVQVFQNLAGNAIKFRSGAAPRIHVSAESCQDEWIFSVRDNGIGIEEQFLQRIFQMFERLHSQTEYPGTGIGLTIAKQIVQRHGGRIWVESQAGKGSIFFFTIPTRGWQAI
jgi:signal transduction histidine kinase